MIINGVLQGNNIHIDNGFFFGEGLFETMLIHNGNVIFLKEHLERINKGLKILNINKEIDEKEIVGAIKKLNCKSGVLKLAVSDKNNIITVRDNNYNEDMYKRGFKLKLSELRRNKYSISTYLKSLNYLDNILEFRKCKKEGYDEVIFLNPDNDVTEGSISNIYFIKNNKIYTPALICGLLDGTIRKYILKNYSVAEGKFTMKDLMTADEIFVTNSIMGIMPVCEIENKFFEERSLTGNIIKNYRWYIENKEYKNK